MLYCYILFNCLFVDYVGFDLLSRGNEIMFHDLNLPIFPIILFRKGCRSQARFAHSININLPFQGVKVFISTTSQWSSIPIFLFPPSENRLHSLLSHIFKGKNRFIPKINYLCIFKITLKTQYHVCKRRLCWPSRHVEKGTE